MSFVGRGDGLINGGVRVICKCLTAGNVWYNGNAAIDDVGDE
jgi:hypothetical protein